MGRISPFKSSTKKRVAWAPYHYDTLSNIPRDPEYIEAEEAHSSAEVLERLLPSLKLDEHINNRAIREAWAGLVGDQLATRSYPDSYKRGILTVRVTDSSTNHHLSALKSVLLVRLKESTGLDVKDMKMTF